MNPIRRVVTGLDAEGRSSIVIDGPAQPVIWSTADVPADNSGNADAGGAWQGMPERGTCFLYSDLPPGGDPFVHATNTIDYIVVLSGEVTIVTDTGETLLRTGDVLVDRGVSHAWRNDGAAPCRILSVLCAAQPVGKGATYFG